MLYSPLILDLICPHFRAVGGRIYTVYVYAYISLFSILHLAMDADADEVFEVESTFINQSILSVRYSPEAANEVDDLED